MKKQLQRKLIELPNGTRVAMFSILNDKYRIWIDLHGFHRWALVRWPDDGIGGVITHGKARSLNLAVSACEVNEVLWKELYNDA